MTSDLYTKIVLTVIAVALLLNVVGDWVPGPHSVKASPGGYDQSVYVTNWPGYETDVTGGPTLYVHCNNCD